MKKVTEKEMIAEAEAAYRSLGSSFCYTFDIKRGWYIGEWVWNVYGVRV